MKINFTKDQYRTLVMMSGIASAVVGPLSDAVSDPDSKYVEYIGKMNSLEEYILQFAGDFQYDEAVYTHEGHVHMDDEFYESKIVPILDDFEEFVVHENLSNALARRDFQREHDEAARAKMAEENGGYFGVELFVYEKRYWDEFDKYGFDRLEIRGDE